MSQIWPNRLNISYCQNHQGADSEKNKKMNVWSSNKTVSNTRVKLPKLL